MINRRDDEFDPSRRASQAETWESAANAKLSLTGGGLASYDNESRKQAKLSA